MTGAAIHVENPCPERERSVRSRRVRVLDNLSTGKRENLAPWLDRIELIEGDIRDTETVRQAMVDHHEDTPPREYSRGGLVASGTAKKQLF